MKCLRVLFILVVITFYLPVSGQSSASDSVIKTTFRYFITTDRKDSIASRNLEYQTEYVTMSHFKCLGDSENFNKILSSLQYHLWQTKTKFFNPDVDTRYWPHPIGNSTIVDTIKGNVYVVHQETEWTDKGKFGNLTGLDFDMDWLYNIRSNKIIINVPDVFLRWHLIPVSGHVKEGDWGYGALWYNNTEMSPQNDNMEPVISDSIVWGKGFSMFLVKDSNRSENLYSYSKYKEAIGNDSSQCVVNDERNLKTLFDYSLVDWIFKQVKDEKMPAYQYLPDGSVGPVLTHKEFNNLTTVIDTVPEKHGYLSVVVSQEVPSLHSGLLVEEELIFNPANFRFEMKITQAAIISFKADDYSYDLHVGRLPLFWVKFE